MQGEEEHEHAGHTIRIAQVRHHLKGGMITLQEQGVLDATSEQGDEAEDTSIWDAYRDCEVVESKDWGFCREMGGHSSQGRQEQNGPPCQ